MLLVILKIKKDTIPEFHEYYRVNFEDKPDTYPIYNKNTINENEFQILVDEKLINSYDNNIMNDFCFSFYNGIFSDRLLFIKFILNFLFPYEFVFQCPFCRGIILLSNIVKRSFSISSFFSLIVDGKFENECKFIPRNIDFFSFHWPSFEFNWTI